MSSPRPSARELLQGLVGRTIQTPTGRPNRVVRVSGEDVIVATERSPEGQVVPIAWVETGMDSLYRDGSVEATVEALGHRSAFIAAVLATLPGAAVHHDPLRVEITSQSPMVTGRNPAWEADELILALDLYLREGQLDDTDPRVIDLSSVLNELPIHADRPDAARFRNPNGVAMKLGNFAALDPDYPGAGLRAGGKRDREVWDRFANARDELAAAAARIRAGVVAHDLPERTEEDEADVVEGRLLYRIHRVRERDRNLVQRKKAGALRRDHRLACEVCGFDFALAYGELGEGFIECHHVLPLADSGERRTRVKDLVLVCSNCHRILHRSRPWMTPAELHALVVSSGSK